MKRILVVVMLTAVWAAAAAEGVRAARPGAYVIGRGDVLEISVWKDEALSRQVVVLPDGTISFPLLGEMEAAGKTVAAFKNELVEKIKTYMPEPVVSVIVTQVNSMQVYVIGKVNKPGRFLLNNNINVLQALALAGGLNPFAKKDEIMVVRRDGEGRTRVFPFEYDRVVKDAAFDQNITLRRGDVVVVP